MDPKSAMGSTSGSSKLKNTTWNNNNKISNNEKVMKSGVKWDYPYGGYGCSWPPRHYTCSFCKREFKSAQALGGHMNVHRRDRAATFIHHSPPPSSSTSLSWLHAYEIPNPNPSGLTSLSSSSSSSSPTAARASIYTHQYSLVSLSLSCLSSSALPYTSGENQSVDLGEIFHGPSSSNFKGGFSSKDDKDQAAVKLDLELGLIRDTKVDDDHDLDLELRLGNQKP